MLARSLILVLAAMISLAFASACQGAQEAPAPTGPVAEAATSLIAAGAALDAHTHLMSPELASLVGAEGAATAEDLIEKLDEANVESAVVLSTAYFSLLPDDDAMRAENDYAAEEVARGPARLIGFCGINPLRGAALDEVDRCIDDLGMKGLKLHLAGSGIDLTDDANVIALDAVFDKASERQVPILMHVANPIGLPLDSEELTKVGIILAEHPDVRVAFAHCFSLLDNQQLEILVEGIRQGLLNGENLFLDTSACLSTYASAPLAQRELVVWRLREFGIDRVFFGSDYLNIDPTADTPAEALDILSMYPFTQDEIDQILGNNGSAWLEGQ